MPLITELIDFVPVLEECGNAEHQGLQEYGDYARIELPKLVQETLERMVDSEIPPIEEIIRSQLCNIIQQCQDTVLSNYRAMPSVSSRVAASTAVGGDSSLSTSPVNDGSESLGPFYNIVSQIPAISRSSDSPVGDHNPETNTSPQGKEPQTASDLEGELPALVMPSERSLARTESNSTSSVDLQPHYSPTETPDELSNGMLRSDYRSDSAPFQTGNWDHRLLSPNDLNLNDDDMFDSASFLSSQIGDPNSQPWNTLPALPALETAKYNDFESPAQLFPSFEAYCRDFLGTGTTDPDKTRG